MTWFHRVLRPSACSDDVPVFTVMLDSILPSGDIDSVYTDICMHGKR